MALYNNKREVPESLRRWAQEQRNKTSKEDETSVSSSRESKTTQSKTDNSMLKNNQRREVPESLRRWAQQQRGSAGLTSPYQKEEASTSKPAQPSANATTSTKPRTSADIDFEIAELETKQKELKQKRYDLLKGATLNRSTPGLAEASAQVGEIEEQIKALEEERKAVKKAEQQALIDSGEYRDVSITKDPLGALRDLTVNSFKQGWNETLYGEESFDAMMGNDNEAQKYKEILAGEDYKFIPDNWWEEAISGGAGLLGQMARQSSNERTIGLAAAGGSAGALYGAAAGGGLGSAITAPIGATAGFSAGLITGNAAAAFEVEAGHAYNEMIENGISEDTAKKIAMAVGGVNAAIEMAQVDELIDAFKVLRRTGTTQSAAKRIAQELLDRGVDILKETGQEVLQESTTMLGTQAGSQIDKGESAYTWDEVGERLWDTAKSSALSFGFMNVPAGARNINAIAKDQRVGSQMQEMGSETVQAIVEEGLSTPENTESHKIAVELQRKMDAGQEISAVEIGNLYRENVRNVDATVAPAGATETAPETLEDAAREVNRSAQAANEAARMTAESVPYNVMSESNPARQAVLAAKQMEEDYASSLGYGEHGRAALKSVSEQAKMSTAQANAEFHLPYLRGLSNMELSEADITSDAQLKAFNAGRMDRIQNMNLDAEKAAFATVHGKESGLIKTEFNRKFKAKTVATLNKASKAFGTKSMIVAEIWQKDGVIVPKGTKGAREADAAMRDDGVLLISANAGDPMFALVKHEFTHRFQQLAPAEYRQYRDAVVQYFVSGESVGGGSVVEAYQNELGLNVERSADEIAADFTSQILKNEKQFAKFVDSLLDTKKNTAEKIEENRTFLKKMGEVIREFIDKIRKAFGGNTSKMDEAARAEFGTTVESLEAIEKRIEGLWKQAAVAAAEAAKEKTGEATTKRDGKLFRTTEADGTTVLETSVGNPVAMMDENGSAQFSMKTYNDFGRAELKRWLDLRVSKGQLAKADALDIVRQMDEYYDLCQKFLDKYAPFGAWSNAEVVRDGKGKPVFSVVKANGEYAMNLDFSLVCKKRRTLDAVFKEMIRRGVMDNVTLEEADIAKVNDIIRESGFETACALCFVDSKRYRQGKVTDTFVNQYNEMVRKILPADGSAKAHHFDFVGTGNYDDTGVGLHTMTDAQLRSGIENLKQVMRENGKQTVAHKIAKHLLNNPQDRKLVSRSDFMNTDGFGAAKTKNPAVLKLYNSSKGAGGPKAAFSDVQYLGEILKKNNFTPARAYAVGGVRIQSFSDYVPRLVFDYLQMVADLSAKGLPAHAYTKEATFAKQFGMTGIKMNLSLVPAIDPNGVAPGLDANGDYFWFDGQSFGSDVNVKGSGKTGYELAIKIQNAPGYSANCGTIAVGVSDQHILKMLDDENIRMIIPYHKSSLNHIVAVMNNIDQYTDYTGEQNTRNADGTKISGKDFNFNEALRRTGDAKTAANEYLAWCEKNGYIPKFDSKQTKFSEHENYYKLLEDFSTYDNGVAAPQGAVTMTFPKDGDAFGSMAQLIEEGLEEDAVLEGRREKAVPEIVDKVERTLSKRVESGGELAYNGGNEARFAMKRGDDSDIRGRNRVDNLRAEGNRLDNNAGGRGGDAGATTAESTGLNRRERAEVEAVVYGALETTEEGKRRLAGSGIERVVDKLLSILTNTREMDELLTEAYPGLELSDIAYIRKIAAPKQKLMANKTLTAEDKEYFAALKSDKAKAEQMVREAAERAGYTLQQFHFTDEEDLKVFKFGEMGFHVGTLAQAKYIAKGRQGKMLNLYVKANSPLYWHMDIGYWSAKEIAATMDPDDSFEDFPNAEEIRERIREIGRIRKEHSANEQLREYLKSLGYDSIKYENTQDRENGDPIGESYILFDSEQLKSADVETRDDYDNPIPLSQRFDNSKGDIRFSTKGQSDLLAENAKLKEVNAALREQFKTTKFAKVDKKSLDTFTRKLLRDYESGADITDTRDALDTLYTYIANGENGESPVWQEAYSRAYEVAKDILESAVTLNDESYREYSELRKELRTRPIKYDKSLSSDLMGYEGIEEFRKANYGRIKMANDGTPVDVYYSDLASRYPELFDEYDHINAADRLVRIAEVLDSLQPTEVNPYSYNMREAATWLANDIMERFYELPQAKPTFADKAERKLTEQVIRDRKQLEKLREQKNKRIAEVIKRERIRTEERVSKERQKRDTAVAELKERYKEKDAASRESRNAKELRGKIVRHAKDLSQKLLAPNDKHHVPEELREPVAALLYSINQESLYSIDPATGKRSKSADGLPTKRTEAFRKLRDKYADIAKSEELTVDPSLLGDSASGFKGWFDEVLDMGDIPLAEMNTEQLGTVWKVLRAVEHSVNTAGKVLSSAKFTATKEWADAMQADTATRRKRKGSAIEKLRIDLENPYTFFSHFGDAGNAVFRMMRDAQDHQQMMVEQVRDEVRKIVDPKTVKNLERETHNFTTERGNDLTLTTAQIMEIRELMRREQAKDHLLKGGIVQPEIKHKKIKRGTDAVLLTEVDLLKITSKLTEEQIRIADSLQGLTTSLLADFGNKASMKAYGYKKFTGSDYFPIKSAREGVHTNIEKGGNNTRSIKNIGMAKSVVPHASNPLDIGGIFKTFSSHAADMTDYAAWLCPMEDANRLFNFRFRDDMGQQTGKTIKGLLDRIGGAGSQKYWQNLMEDIQNGLTPTSDSVFTNAYNTVVGNVKGASVGANIRVIVQQPTAILRAAAVLNPVDMAKGLVYGGGWKTALEHSAIAKRKDMGGFDISNPMQMNEILFDSKTGLQKFNDTMMWGAGKADAVTWGRIWNACEFAVLREHKGVERGSEEFYAAVAQKFTEVVDQSQVVDGVLQRSQTMRSGNAVVKQATAFMGEPTMALNMMLRAYDAVRNEMDSAKRGKALKMLGRTTAALLVTNVVNALAQSVVDAWRDDEDEEYLEKLRAAFTGISGDEGSAWDKAVAAVLSGNLGNSLNPVGYVPFAKDALSILQGYNVTRADADVMGDIISAAQTFIESASGDGKKTVPYAMKNLAQQVGKAFGVSAPNILRDVWGVARTIAIETGNIALQYEMEKAIYKIDNDKNTSRFVDVLYKAYMEDKDVYRHIYDDMASGGFAMDKIRSQMESRMKKEQGVNKVGDLEQRYLDPAQQPKYDRTMSKISGSGLWSNATEKQRDKVEGKLYDLVTNSKTGEELQEKIDEGRSYGLSETDYLLYTLALDMYDQPNKNGEYGGTPTSAEKAAAIESLGNLSDGAIAYLWDTKQGYEAFAGGVDMGAFVDRIASDESVSVEKLLGAKNAGMSDEEYYGFLDALEAHDTPTESGKYGTFTQDEAKAAIASLPDLTREQRAYLWQSMNSSWKEKNNPWR